MDVLVEAFQRIWENLMARPSGPLAFRLVIQPLVATTFAILDGVRDGRAGRSVNLSTFLIQGDQRRKYWGEGLKATGRIMVFAFVLDTIYQIIVLKAYYPGEALIIAAVLGFLPYVLVRGPVAGFVRRRHGQPKAGLQ